MKKKLFKLIIAGVVVSSLFSGCTSKEMKKAKEFMEASMYDQAISLLDIEIQDNPKNAEANFLLGKCYLQTSNHSKVEKYFRNAVLLDPDYKEDIGNICYEKSLELYKVNDTIYANLYYEEGLKNNPTFRENFAKQLFDYASEYSESSTESSIASISTPSADIFALFALMSMVLISVISKRKNAPIAENSWK